MIRKNWSHDHQILTCQKNSWNSKSSKWNGRCDSNCFSTPPKSIYRFHGLFFPWNCHIHFFQIRLKVVAKRNFNDWILFRQWRLLLLLLWDHFSNREKILCGYLIVCCGKREKNHHRNFWSCSDFSWNCYSSFWSYVGVRWITNLYKWLKHEWIFFRWY